MLVQDIDAPVCPLPELEVQMRPMVRCVLERTSDGTLQRLLKITPCGFWLMPMNTESGWCTYQRGGLDDLMAAGGYRLAPSERAVPPKLEEHDRRTSEQRFATFGAAFVELDRLLTSEEKALALLRPSKGGRQ